MKAKLKEIRDAVDKKFNNARDLWLMANTSGGPMNLPAMRYFARNGRLPVVKGGKVGIKARQRRSRGEERTWRKTEERTGDSCLTRKVGGNYGN